MKNKEQSRLIAALYTRLSDDDEKDGTSVSIETQEKILTDFCKQHNICIYDVYIDDGFTGTNFNRPDFKRMMEDVNAKRVNVVIVKDLSRFGRNYLQVPSFSSSSLSLVYSAAINLLCSLHFIFTSLSEQSDGCTFIIQPLLYYVKCANYFFKNYLHLYFPFPDEAIL